MSQFSEGQSGNLSGRPKGIKDRRILFAEMLDTHKQALFDKAIELALNGNEQMLRLLLDRLLPAKPKDDPLLEIDLHGSIEEKTSKIMSLLADGKITPIETNELLEAIKKEMEITDIKTIKQEITAIVQILKLRNEKQNL